MKMLLAGGGTGGHLFPAVALAQRHLETDPTAEVLFVGTKAGIEAKILPDLSLPLATIEISGIAGLGWSKKISMLPVLFKSVRQSLEILKRFQPQIVVGVGGYASGPALLAAKLLGIPYLIHEQNASFGMTNRFLSRWAKRICLSFPLSAEQNLPPERTIITGNPVRSGISEISPLQEGNPTLLVFGGSRGAQAINDVMVSALPELLRALPDLRVIHQTGSTDYERICKAYESLGISTKDLTPFINDMAEAYERAHLILCRAGATTLAELTTAGRPAVLIPYPHAAADHQTVNAMVLANCGAALLLPQQEISGSALPTLLKNLLNDRPTLLRMAGIARSLGQPSAVDKLLAECRAVAGKG